MEIEQLLELIALVHWHTNEHCGADFDEISCYGSDNGPCSNYDFCKKYAEIQAAIAKTKE